MFKNFFNAKLKCTGCTRTLYSGDEIYVHLTLPEEKKMPVGILDKVLSKHAETVYCEMCYKR